MNLDNADIKLKIQYLSVSSLCLSHNIWLVKISEGGEEREREGGSIEWREREGRGRQETEEVRNEGGERKREKREARNKRKREESAKRG